MNSRFGDWGLRHGDWTVWIVSARNLCTIVLFLLLLRTLARAAPKPLTG